MERLKPLNDFIFKRIFGEEESKEALVSFLNAVLGLKDREKLVTLKIIDNKELIGEMLEDKTARLDVRAETKDGTQLEIEVQLTNQKNMDKRTLFYWGRLFQEKISKGQDYKELSKVITINILDFEFLDIDRFHSIFNLREDVESSYMLTDILEIQFIELPKFRRMQEKNIKENALHRWLTFLEQELPDEVLKELMEMDAAIRKAEEKLEYLSSDPKMRALYRAREESLYERNSMINGAKEEGKIEGKIEDILELLSEFGEIPRDLRKIISKQTDIEKLKKWMKLAAKSESIEDFKNKINN